MHILSICTLWSWPRPNMINHLWLNISSIHTKIYIYISTWISSLYTKILSQPGNHCDYSFIPEYHLHRHKMVVALQPLWILILHVYSFYTHNMVTAQQPLLLLIHRCITSPYTQYGHGPAPMWLISYDWISLPHVQKKKSSLYEYHLYTENIVTAWQPLWLLISINIRWLWPCSHCDY